MHQNQGQDQQKQLVYAVSNPAYSAGPNQNVPAYDQHAPQTMPYSAGQPDVNQQIDGVTGRSTTYKDVIKDIYKVAASLYKKGLRKGDVLMIVSPNCSEYPILLLATSLIGGVISTCNPIYTATEIEFQMGDADVSYLVTCESSVQTVHNAADKYGQLREIFVLGEAPGCTAYASLLTNSGQVPEVHINPKEDLFLLPYSSGTTGKPKGVMLTHHNLVTNICMYSQTPDLYFGTGKDDVFPGVLPYFHTYGVMVLQLYPFYNGHTIIPIPKFNLEPYLQTIERYKATCLVIVPPIAVAMAKSPLTQKYDLSSVKDLLCGAAPMGKDLQEEVAAKTGIKHVRQGFGMSETSPGVLTCAHSGWSSGSCGQIVPNTECIIADLDTGKPLSPNKRGELWIKGPQVMKGYLNRPDATASTIDKDGWLHTGDIAYYDDDKEFFIVDRIKELIKYKGFQVAPAEVESILLTHPAVADVAVIGIPDVEAGELPRAYIVKKPYIITSEDEIHKYLAEQVAPYKRLRGGIEFVSEIPKSAAGKILRRFILASALEKMKKSKL